MKTEKKIQSLEVFIYLDYIPNIICIFYIQKIASKNGDQFKEKLAI